MKLRFIIFLYCAIVYNTAFAGLATVFNYQGEVIYNGSPANGEFMVAFKLFSAEVGGNQISAPSVQLVNIEDGLLNTEILFESNSLSTTNPLWMEVSIDDPENLDTFVLNPRIKLNTVPTATLANTAIHTSDNSVGSSSIINGQIANIDLLNRSIKFEKFNANNANNDDVIQYNSTNSQWEAHALPTPIMSPWSENANNVYFDGGNVGIGTTNPNSLLQINGDSSNELLLLGNTSPPVIHFRREVSGVDWVLKQNPDGTKFHMQTELTDGHEILTLVSTGEVGIGTTNPTGLLDVRNSSNEVLLNVNSNGIIKRKTKTSFLTLSYHAFQTTNSQEDYKEISAGTIDGFTNEPRTTAIKLVAPINLPVNQATIIGFELLSFDNDPAASITARIFENDFLINNTPSEIVALTSGVSIGEEHLSNNALNYIYLQNTPYYVHVTLPAQGILGTDLVFSAVRISYQYDEL